MGRGYTSHAITKFVQDAKRGRLVRDIKGTEPGTEGDHTPTQIRRVSPNISPIIFRKVRTFSFNGSSYY